jgi:hypothetical protein
MALDHLVFVLGLTISTIVGATSAQAATSIAASIPMATVHQGNQTVTAPNWTQMTFAALPHLLQAGKLSLPDGRLIRQWQRGQEIADVLTLGDFQDSFRLQNLNLYEIAVATDMAPDEASLGRFNLMHRQTIKSLVAAIPRLADIPVNQIPPISDLIATTKLPPQLAALTIDQLLDQTPALADLSFEAIPLNQYHLTDIPDLITTPFSKFEHWQDAKVSDIPNLGQLPWSELPNPPIDNGMIATVKAVEATEQALVKPFKSISGSEQAGYAVGCPSKSCASVTFTGNTVLDRKYWIASSTQVSGGQGDWKMINGGQEPTGRSIFTPAFKVAIVQTQPEIKTALFFKACRTNSGDALNCSPYAIGAIPLQTLHDGDAMFIGEIPVSAVGPALPSLSNSAPAPIILPLQNAPTSEVKPFWKEWIDEIEAWFESAKSRFS